MALPRKCHVRLGSLNGALLWLAIVGCGGGGTSIITPPPPPPVGFALTFLPDPADVASAGALGWANGLPGLEVTVTPKDSSTATRSFTSSAQGTLTVSDLLAKDYIIEARRWLSVAERAALAVGDDAVGFATSATVTVSSTLGQAQVRVPASRRKGLIISEWAFNHNAYSFDGYIELHNNSDTTVYLDGLTIGEGWWASLDTPSLSCAVSEPFRNDPAGIWSRSFQRFPGTGTQFPLSAGQTVVVATDAIDHRPLNPGSLDLRAAGFEFVGTSDVDNPAVPNMVDEGLVAYPDGHGLQFFFLLNVPFIALPVDVATLVHRIGPSGTTEWVRFPATRILDALAIGTNYPPPAGSADCPPLVHASFDRQESRVRGTDGPAETQYSLSRRRVPGGTLLQWTRSGAADFVRGPRTPGVP